LPDEHGQPIDLGRVGEVTEVDDDPIVDSCLAGIIPVLPSIAEDVNEGDTGLYNVNADTAAAAVAMALKAEKLVFLTDIPGILVDRRDEETLLRSLTPDDCRDLIARGVIDKGMIPKVEACLASLEAGVKKAHIVDGRMRHSLLVEMYTTSGVGTEIVLKAEAVNGQRPAAGPDRVSVQVSSRANG
jgi:acetylglutamate kinase